jgi:peptidoglycan/xylan/chitin deacetylase (PgdA/CDA1 family)
MEIRLTFAIVACVAAVDLILLPTGSERSRTVSEPATDGSVRAAQSDHAETPAVPNPAPASPSRAIVSCPDNPNALGVSRTIEIDTTGGPGFGSEQFTTDNLPRDGEVILTFDDGPWPKNTPKVLAALAHHCTKATFFPIGLHAIYHTELLKQVAAAGHSIGSHTWCHEDLSRTRGRCRSYGRTKVVDYTARDEIEKGISAVQWAAGSAIAPFFRFPALRHPPEVISYLGRRNIAIFSADVDTVDFKLRKPELVRKSVIEKLSIKRKGIILMHDFQTATAAAIEDILGDLKAGGYKIVFMIPKSPVTTIPEYDQVLLNGLRARQPVPGLGSRPKTQVGGID